MRDVSVCARRLLVASFAALLLSCELTSVGKEEREDGLATATFEAVVHAAAAIETPIDTLTGRATVGSHVYIIGWADPTGVSRTDTVRAVRLTFADLSGPSVEELVQVTLPDEALRVAVYSESVIRAGSPPRRFQAFYTPDGVCQYTRLSGTTEILSVASDHAAGRFDLQMMALQSVQGGQASTTCPGAPQQIRVTGRFDAEVMR